VIYSICVLDLATLIVLLRCASALRASRQRFSKNAEAACSIRSSVE